MKLKIIGTGSSGNAYVLENDSEILLIEAGVVIKEIKQAIDFNLSKVVGCIVTHEHMDHAKALPDVIRSGIDVYASAGTLMKRNCADFARAKTIKSKSEFKIGNFKILPFDVKHDAKEPLGFLIEHPDCGKVLFLTDCMYTKYIFPPLNNIIIEANFSNEIINRKFGADSKMEFLRNRILRSHFSLANCQDMLAANDLGNVNNIVLIHLSDSNSDERVFEQTIRDQTGKTVTAARNGMTLNFKKTPF